MVISYKHELDKDIAVVCGWYKICIEQKVEYKGVEYLYLVGEGALASSCCGTGGWHYVVVPGAIVNWKMTADKDGVSVSLLKPVDNQDTKDELRRIIVEKEKVDQVQFW